MNVYFHNTRPNGYRKAVSQTLGCHVQGAKLPHPDLYDTRTTLAGALKRFCTEPPVPNRATFEELIAFCCNLIKKHFQPLCSTTDVTVERWLNENRTYTQARKKELLGLSKSMNPVLSPDHLKVKSFVKDESYPTYKHARCINSRDDKFKVMVGPIFHLIEKELFKKPWFIKYVPVPDRPLALRDLIYQVGALYGETDYAACEAHFDRLRFRIEFEFYKYMVSSLPEGQEFMRNLNEGLLGKNKCIFKDFTLFVIASRMSGEMNTSLGNGFVNWVLAEFNAHRLNLTNFVGIYEGDDGALRADPLPTQQDYRDVGFNVTIEPRTEISGMSFCGLVFDPEDLAVVTDPLVELVSFGWTNARYVKSAHKTRMALLRAKSISLLYQYPACPVLRNLALYGLRVTSGFSTDRIVKQMSVYEREQFQAALQFYKTRFQWLLAQKIGTNTRHLVESKFGLPVHAQLSIEHQLDNKNDISPISVPPELLMEEWKDFYSRYCFEVPDTWVNGPPFVFPTIQHDNQLDCFGLASRHM